ncbi:hypothetical protein V8J08_003615 [Citrobacter amalonaticus]|uniref:hypothetical protein n=1 Tax=Citrobacter sp. CFNIH10 TaxID=1920110 RepID=UPI000CEC2CC0|nr:hypothetical protein [Citrobacter sp. CFNIH10]AUZ66654.1 hypothetical protein C2U53_24025 [Citrobacter sp. CFNIH10]
MAKIIFTVTTKEVFSEGSQVKEVVDVNVQMEGVNYESPNAADHIASIINRMSERIIKAANIHYMNEWKARSGNTESNTTH